jgi:Fic family protein
MAGKWRTVAVQVGAHIPPEYYLVPSLMLDYAANVQAHLESADTLDLQLELLTYAEGEFLHIHPFQDFNGRTVRVLLTELLIRLNLPVIDVSVERDTRMFEVYRNALAEYDNSRREALSDFWIERLSRGDDRYEIY